ncbi:DNA topoisomerase IV subunit A [Methanococcus voltae]|uniref:Type 2 DNA topoisomerase 6 subunit A n=2 Tax=Methanococcus voltae TaxID=2188 RepID=A0A8J7RMV3_METVO|nr:DNA topoisomerase IV subunit A [Methanococcus voltae]MBP2172789.1 DNA topoisomerase-6 subunit A [Methanococcus voltae]MBP2201801.1 DNA topoisomerase-6 subunit A [Methanococcus voltae]MCS3922625.1 DNA topoisomerase-6 subunit A [Methanococcus voltae PS]
MITSKERKLASQKLLKMANQMYDDIIRKKRPVIKFPVRSLSNAKFDDEKGTFTLMGKEKERTFNVNQAKIFAQTIKMMEFSKSLLDTNDFSTLREAYYVSKNWGEARFDDQQPSNSVIEDLEAASDFLREDLGFMPEEDGASVVGPLKVIDKTQDGQEIIIDCTKLGSGAYNIPNEVTNLTLETNAEFVLAIETAGMFARLSAEGFWKKHNCILVSLKGVPSRATRRFVKRLSEEKKLPILVFTDGDPYGYLNIYRTLKVGSGKAVHLADKLAVPEARMIGVTPQDIVDYELPTHPLKDHDIKRLKDGLKNDDFVKSFPEWQNALSMMADSKVRAEQQSLAKYGLKYVVEEYLPAKVEDQKTWLP